MDANEFTAKLAKVLQRLKKDLGAEYVNQNYRGTGKRAHRRQLFVRWDGGKTAVDLWLEADRLQIGGVILAPASVKVREVLYGDKDPEQVYAAVLAALRGEALAA